MKLFILLILLLISGCVIECSPDQIYLKGKCMEKCTEKPEYCIMVYDPVCGSDGETYSNSCVACSKDVEGYVKGECK